MGGLEFFLKLLSWGGGLFNKWHWMVEFSTICSRGGPLLFAAKE